MVIDLEWDGADRLVVMSSLGWGLWDCTRRQMLTWHGPHPATACVAFSRTKRLLAFADGSRVEVYSTLHPDRVVAAITRAADVTQLDFSERGELLAVGDTDGVVELLDPRTLSTVSKAALHSAQVFQFAFAPGGGRIASSGQDERAVVWDWRAGGQQVVVKGDGELASLLFSPDGERLAINFWLGDKVLLFGAPEWRCVGDLRGRNVKLGQFLPGGRHLVRMGSTVRLWTVNSPELPVILDCHSQVYAGDVSLRDDLIVVGYEDGTLVGGRLDRRCVLFRTTAGQSIYAVAISSDQSKIATGEDGAFQIWDVRREIAR
jgi:WD40 repeat protein